MARKKADLDGTERASVTTVTCKRRKHGGGVEWLALVAGIGSVAVSCGDGGSAATEKEEVWTAKAVQVDGGVSAEGGRRDDPAKIEGPTSELCSLSGPPASTPGDVLVYSQDFDGSTLDPLSWSIAKGYRGHGGIANKATPESAVVADGRLAIVTTRNPSDTEHPYTSGLIESLGKFARTYGKIEFRARFPYAAGVWYAIWGRPWSQPFPEIDIEIVNRPRNPKTELYFVNHWAAPPLPANDRRAFVMTDTLDVSVFHTYTILWKPGSLEWQFDGVSKLTAPPEGVPNLPVYWIINGWVGGWPGAPTDATPFPNTFEVDYMRVYRVDGVIAHPVIRVMNARTKYSRTAAIEIALANFDEACAHVEMYDGPDLLRTTSTRPFRLAVSRLAPGPHTLTFIATDGVRRTSATLETEVN